MTGHEIGTRPEIRLGTWADSRRPGLTPAVIILALGGAAWVWTYLRMSGMPGGPNVDLGGLAWFSLSWLVMMAAMMLPSAARTIRVSRPFSATDTIPFTVGYLGIWLVAGLAAYAGMRGVRDLHVSWLQWSHGGRFLAGGVILAAGAYQLTGLKRTCLERCRIGHERPPHRGFASASAAWLGVKHGCVCLGCCGALMAALFALGVMSIVWMVVISVLITVERLLPPRFATRAVTVALVVLGLMVALAPGQLPGFSSPSRAPAMMRMG